MRTDFATLALAATLAPLAALAEELVVPDGIMDLDGDPAYGAYLGGEELDHVVGQRLGGGDHLALLHEEPHDVGGGPVQLGAEFLGGGGTIHHHLALGHRAGAELRERMRADAALDGLVTS